MKKIFAVICGLILLTGAKAQEKNFLNYSICTPPAITPDFENNEYVQGNGHNYYLSYPMADQLESFSEDKYSYGSDNNPMIIYVDSTDQVVKKYYLNPENSDIYAGMDLDYAYISRGLWPYYSDEDDILIGPDLNYEEYVLQCTLEKEDNTEEDKFKQDQLRPQIYVEYMQAETMNNY